MERFSVTILLWNMKQNNVRAIQYIRNAFQKAIINHNWIFFSVISIYHILQLLKRKRIVFSNTTTNKMKPIDFLTWYIRNFISFTCKCCIYIFYLFHSYCTNFRYKWRIQGAGDYFQNDIFCRSYAYTNSRDLIVKKQLSQIRSTLYHILNKENHSKSCLYVFKYINLRRFTMLNNLIKTSRKVFLILWSFYWDHGCRSRHRDQRDQSIIKIFPFLLRHSTVKSTAILQVKTGKTVIKGSCSARPLTLG